MSITPILIPQDNYSYLICSQGNAVVIDASDSEAVLRSLKAQDLRLLAVFSTHHHSDHTSGNLELKRKTGCTILAMDKRVSGVEYVLKDNEVCSFEGISIQALHVPGHTKLQAAYYLQIQQSLFTGDTLFGAGCGRLFEGSAEQMYRSLERLASFPDETCIYFGHEYTLENLEFACTMEPDNEDIALRIGEVRIKVGSGNFTVPSTVILEKKTNPFLRCRELSLRKHLAMVERSPIAVFSELRRRKDLF